MQNKGAIRLFAILLGLSCAYYLMFTWKAFQIEHNADAYAEAYEDKALKRSFYLDSMKHKTVLDMGIASYTYDEVQQRQLNLGLDLKGGMNVTLEISKGGIIRSLSNNSKDPAFNTALVEADKRYKSESIDFITAFSEEFHKTKTTNRLASYFQTIELKGEIDYNTSDEDVLIFLRDRVKDAIETSENTLRSRIDKFGVTQPNIQMLPSSGRILIELPGVTDKARVRKLLQGTANLEFWETHENEEVYPLLDKANARLAEILQPAADTTAVVVDDKKEEEVKPVVADADSTSGNSLLDQLALGGDTGELGKGATSREDSIAKISQENPLFIILAPSVGTNEQGQQSLRYGPVVGSSLVGDTAKVNEYLNMPQIKSIFKSYTKFAWKFKAMDKEETRYELIALDGSKERGEASLAGDVITDARSSIDMAGGGYASISMSMTAQASQEWRRLTKENIGKSVAIVLDNSVYSYPTVNGEIPNGTSSITGDFTPQEAGDLVNILKAGKLPAPARIVEENVVGPTLGAEAVSKGMLSTFIALILVLIFMGLYYGKAGWVASFAMIINNFFVIGILASFGAVLTLPGIAGIVLTIAMSVDANILIYERIREELALGKSIGAAIKEGFKNAMSSVIDSHITTLLLGIILFVFGSGPLQGFATTLIIGVISSLFCAIFITRLVFDRWLEQGKDIPFGNSMTINAFKNFKIDFVGKRKLYYLTSAVIIALGVFSYVQKGGFSLGVDFKGGRSYVVRFDEVKSTEEVRNALATSFGEAPEVKTYGEGNQQRITTTYLIDDNSDNAETNVEAKLFEGLNSVGSAYEIMSSQKVGEIVSKGIKEKALYAVLLSCLVMFIFIYVRFRKMTYGIGAIVALLHDVLIVLSLFLIFDGILPFSLEITQDFIAALLTVMSYSMVDSVVVFDRIREYLTERNKDDLDEDERVTVINYALNSTLSRTINTALTIFFVMFAIFAFGGETIRGFSFALLIGVVVGTYSSICIATPIVIDLEGDTSKKSK